MVFEPDLRTSDGRFKAYCIASQMGFNSNQTMLKAQQAKDQTDRQAGAYETLTATYDKAKKNRAAWNAIRDEILELGRDDEWLEDERVCGPLPPQYTIAPMGGLGNLGALPALALWSIVGGVVTSVAVLSVGEAFRRATQAGVIEWERTNQKQIQAYRECLSAAGGNPEVCGPILKGLDRKGGPKGAAGIIASLGWLGAIGVAGYVAVKALKK